MPWRDALIAHLAPGFLAGITFGDWLRLLQDNRVAVAPRRLPRAATIAWHAAQNTAIARLEERRYGPKLEGVTVLPPIFILGHWRNGTTHLHNLLATDQRFAFPTMYQALFPHTFLTTEASSARIMGFFLTQRRPMDNVEWSMQSPQEDEFALCASSLRSPYLGWVFPSRRRHYDRYLTLSEVPPGEVQAWRQAFLRFLTKLTWKHGRPLVLKSPTHTCRIGHLLAMFPDARFVHIRRDPYAVFPSSRAMFQVNFAISGLERPRLDGLDDWILRQYQLMYERFFEERALIPEGRLHEVRFEEIEADPVGEVARLYDALDLPDFPEAEGALRRYVDRIAGYRKNAFPTLPADMRARIARAWRPCFEAWGYAE